ncbi:hypothetical protein HTG_02430 [Natrinema mahii]|nr:hypothetical protein HTG_02430 [Natrinema mahii]
MGSKAADTRRSNRRSDPLEPSRGTVVSAFACSDPLARRAIDARRPDPTSGIAPITAVAIATSSFRRVILSLETHAFGPPAALATTASTGACVRTVTEPDTIAAAGTIHTLIATLSCDQVYNDFQRLL